MNPLSPTCEEIEAINAAGAPQSGCAVRAERPVDGLPAERDVIDGKYELTRLIGEGGMGLVYEAVDLRTQGLVAIKFLHPEAASAPGALHRFLREAHAALQLRGPHVARVLDVSARRPNPYMVMELLRGRDLEAELRARGALPIEEAVDIVLQCCEAMKEAHERGIIHRDLKPSNIFLATPSGAPNVADDGAVVHPIVKVVDFGVSLIAAHQNMARVTATSMSVGTPLYMSPEQVRCSKRVDARTDIWALGVVLFEALVGEPPFDGTSTAAVAAIVADETPSTRASRPDVPLSLDGVIARALTKDVRGRFQTVEELAEALAPFGSGRVRRKTRVRVEEIARTWLAWPPARRSKSHTASLSSRAPAFSRFPGGRVRLVAALGACLVVLPAITFGFARDGVKEVHGPAKCMDAPHEEPAPDLQAASTIIQRGPIVPLAEARDEAAPRPTPDVTSKARHDRRTESITPTTNKSRAGATNPSSDDPLYL